MANKRKRQKKKHLTQEEIWDDSALIQSWDDAVEEYKLYHSIQARGEDVEEILRQEEAKALAGAEELPEEGAKSAMDWHTVPEPNLQNGDDSRAEVREPDDTFVSEATAHGKQNHPSRNNVQQTSVGDEGFSGMPRTVFGQNSQSTNQLTSVDDGLKNLMMSWYYAGYYTGLYEAQQKLNQR